MNEAIWGGRVTANFVDKNVSWEVEFGNSPSKDPPVNFKLQSGHLAANVASKLAAAWIEKYGIFSATTAGRSVHFAGNVSKMRVMVDGVLDWTEVPKDHSAVQVVPGLFVFLG